MKIRYIILLLIPMFLGCNINFALSGDLESNIEESTDTESSYSETITAIEEIRLKAYYAAEAYLSNGMEYELGGDDEIYIVPYTRGIDCSGLVINCYEFAVDDTDYFMPFDDATADDIYNNYSDTITDPEEGDLIFWTDSSNHAYHIAIFEKIESGRYYFIESNDLSDYGGIVGVGYRSMSVDTTYTISIKRLNLDY